MILSPTKADIIRSARWQPKIGAAFAMHFDDRIAAIEHLTENGTRSQGM
jgi:hypothetical protein